ncbi:hypothetical protein AB0C87_25150 [Actinomadura sp. NPDC048021]|uniref:hypothetical protein n=1 Tax=Actinomadura sp. NPDC048021 TaxID=3155385 RepID=UPI00340E996F
MSAKTAAWHEVHGLVSFSFSPSNAEAITDGVYEAIKSEVLRGRVNDSPSVRVLESWRGKAREESEYEFYWPRYITGLPEVDLTKLARDYQVIVLGAD